MDDALFDDLMEGVREVGRDLREEDVDARTDFVDEPDPRAIRQKADLTQEEFAEKMNISVDTLRNWEQGRRNPTGPAVELLRRFKRLYSRSGQKRITSVQYNEEVRRGSWTKRAATPKRYQDSADARGHRIQDDPRYTTLSVLGHLSDPQVRKGRPREHGGTGAYPA